jgi:arginine utilization protein RocB
MKKLLVLFISLLLIFSINCFSLANEIAIRVGDETLSEEALTARINQGTVGDPRFQKEGYEVVNIFIRYALVKNTIEKMDVKLNMDAIHNEADKKMESILERHDINVEEMEQLSSLNYQQMKEDFSAGIGLEVLENYYLKQAREFVTDQMIDEILYIRLGIKPEKGEKFKGRLRLTLLESKLTDLVHSKLYEEYEKGFSINTNQVDREKVIENFSF